MKRTGKAIWIGLSALVMMQARFAMAGGWLGITVQSPEGVQVGEIMKDGPGDKAGLHRNDILMKMDGKPITSLAQFMTLLESAPPGREMVLNLLRRGEERELKITPDDSALHQSVRPDGRQIGGMEMAPAAQSGERVWRRSDPPWQQQGVSPLMPGNLEPSRADVEPPRMPMASFEPPEPPATAWLGVAPELTQAGVTVTQVAPGGPGERAGMKPGDVIISVSGQSVSSPRAMARVLRSFRPKDLVEVTINRNGQIIDVQAQLIAPPAASPASVAPGEGPGQ
ncbi:MAG: PDZ domain-containing protein [Magnetococcales bacterium]|nr:PDZ domain-containing protein [Magnetococcales bacterium]